MRRLARLAVCAAAPRGPRARSRRAATARPAADPRRLRHGELSYSKVRALTRVAEPDSEEELVGLARYLTAAQLERAVRAYRHVTTEDANDRQDEAYLSCWVRRRLARHQRPARSRGRGVFLRALEAARGHLAGWFRGTT